MFNPLSSEIFYLIELLDFGGREKHIFTEIIHGKYYSISNIYICLLFLECVILTVFSKIPSLVIAHTTQKIISIFTLAENSLIDAFLIR